MKWSCARRFCPIKRGISFRLMIGSLWGCVAWLRGILALLVMTFDQRSHLMEAQRPLKYQGAFDER